MAYNEKTVERVRQVLSEVNHVAEIKMMGGLIFTVRGHMCCGVTDDALMVRVGQEAYSDALTKRHVTALEIGGGRRPRGFVCVAAQGIASKKTLTTWIERGLGFTQTLPAKDGQSQRKKSKKKKRSSKQVLTKKKSRVRAKRKTAKKVSRRKLSKKTNRKQS